MPDDEKIQVLVRVRPLIPSDPTQESCVEVQGDTVVVGAGDGPLDAYQEPHAFAFDCVLGPAATQDDVYARVAPLVDAFAAGASAAVMCYGVTSSGKSHTMFGGVVPRATARLAGLMRAEGLVCTCLQVYNEQVYDLLGGGAAVRLAGAPGDAQGFRAQGAAAYVAREPAALGEVVADAVARRRTAATQRNAASSRSHVVLTLESRAGARLQLVDLAGSERLGPAPGPAGQPSTEVETKYINRSLQTLGLVVRQLAAGARFTNWRDSALTRLLAGALGGPARAAVVVTVAPCAAQRYETLNALRFAECAKRVRKPPAAAPGAPAPEDPLAALRAELARLEDEYRRLAAPAPPEDPAD